MTLEQIGKPLRPSDLPDDKPSPGELRIKIDTCAVCRTDLHAIDGELPNPRPPSPLQLRARGPGRSGAFFFGAASTVGTVLDRIADRHKSFVLDCSGVPFLDSTAANVLEGVVRKASRAGVRVYVTGTSAPMRRLLFAHGVRPPLVRYKASIGNALEQERSERTRPVTEPA